MIFTLALILVLYLIFDFFKKNHKVHKNEPSGPICLPIVGNLFMISENIHIPIDNLTLKFGNIFKMYLGKYKVMVVTDPDIVKDIWVTKLDKFNDRPNLSNITKYSNNKMGITFSSPEIWAISKSLIGGAFTKTKLKLHYKIIEKQTSILINSMNNIVGSKYSPLSGFSKSTMNVLCTLVFGDQVVLGENTKYENEMKILIDSVQSIYKYLGGSNLDNYHPIYKPFYYFSNKVYYKQISQLKGLVETIYQDHLIDFNPDETRDCMDHWIKGLRQLKQFKGNEKLIKDQIVQMGSDCLIAGTDTTSITMCWCLIYIINNPIIKERIVNELFETVGNDCKFVPISYKDKLPYLNNFFKEVMRIRSIAPLGVPRIALEDIFVKGGHFIEKGTLIFQNIYGLSHTFVKDAETINPDRWIESNNGSDNFRDLNSVVMPMSIGNRNCVGSNLSDLELFSVISNIILNFEMSSIDGKPIDDSMIYGLTTHPPPFEILLKKRIN